MKSAERHSATPGGRRLVLLLLVLTALATGSLARKDKHGDHDGKHPSHHDDHKGEHPSQHDSHGDDNEDYELLENRLNKVTTRLENIEDGLAKRSDPKIKTRARSLAHRVHELGEPHCDKPHYDCGGDDHECVSRLMVCDGVKDCRNGDDEHHCELPTKSGDTFVGKVVFDRCTQRHPDEISFTISAVKSSPAFTAFPLLRAIIHIHKHTSDSENELSLPTVGYYRFATQNLILLPPEDDGLALICDFDGSNKDKCVGNIVHQASLETCARFVFQRKH